MSSKVKAVISHLIPSHLISYKKDIQHLWTEVTPPLCSKLALHSTTRWKLCQGFVPFSWLHRQHPSPFVNTWSFYSHYATEIFHKNIPKHSCGQGFIRFFLLVPSHCMDNMFSDIRKIHLQSKCILHQRHHLVATVSSCSCWEVTGLITSMFLPHPSFPNPLVCHMS